MPNRNHQRTKTEVLMILDVLGLCWGDFAQSVGIEVVLEWEAVIMGEKCPDTLQPLYYDGDIRRFVNNLPVID